MFIVAKMSPVETNVEHFLRAEKRKNLDTRRLPGRARSLPPLRLRGRDDARQRTVKHNEQSISDTTIQGITPSVATILDTDLTSGRMLNDTDLNNHLQVAVVGTDIVEHLLGGADPLGQEIRVDGWTYQVIGVGKKKGKTLGQSADNYVLIPVTVYLKQYGSHNRQHSDLGQGHGDRSSARTRPSTKRAWRCGRIATTGSARMTASRSRPTPACWASGRG